MLRPWVLLAVLLQVTCHSVMTEKQQLKLSDSYLPVAMQVISHLTDQMSYEAKDDTTIRPTTKPTTDRPTKIEYVWYNLGDYITKSDGRWEMNYGLKSIANKFGKLGIYASPGLSDPSNAILKNGLPASLDSQYLQQKDSSKDKEHLLGRSSYEDEQDMQNLQRLSQKVRDFVNLDSEPYYKKFGDSWGQTNPGFYFPKTFSVSKEKLERFNELLHKECKKDNLSEFNGFSQKLLKELAESWKGGARAQLVFVLTKATTQSHKPGLYAPPKPPKPSDRLDKYGLLPPTDNFQYTVLEPDSSKQTEPLLAIQLEQVKPLVEPTPNPFQYLPPHVDTDKVSGRSKYQDINEENLQYLSQSVRDMIKLAADPDDERVVDVWDGVRAGPDSSSSKASLSASNLRLLLLYDLLSREAKRQKLSDFTGFSDAVMQDLAESSSGGARAQLSFALSRMVERHDCQHEYANNRAKEMVAELAKDSSTLSSELRYLQPLVYKI